MDTVITVSPTGAVSVSQGGQVVFSSNSGISPVDPTNPPDFGQGAVVSFVFQALDSPPQSLGFSLPAGGNYALLGANQSAEDGEASWALSGPASTEGVGSMDVAHPAALPAGAYTFTVTLRPDAIGTAARMQRQAAVPYQGISVVSFKLQKVG